MSTAALPAVRIGVPSKDGLRLILTGTGYLLTICVLQLVVALRALGLGTEGLPGGLMDTRDFVALYGWVGLMISGVSVIIVPNHLRVRLRPSYLPRLHFALANTGLIGFLAASLLVSDSVVPFAFLALVSASFLAFGLGVLATVLPFARSDLARPSPALPGQLTPP